MLQPPPAQIGMREDEVDTPALLIDLDAFEFNLDTMAALIAPTGAKLRPHAKTHKCPTVAHMQIARGAIGQCTQKVAEAEVLASGGVHSIFVSNEIVGAPKLARFAALSRLADVTICADHPSHVAAIEAAARDADARLSVCVEIDVGGGRCGVQPGSEAVELARAVAGSQHLRFGGLQAYYGPAQHKRHPEERRSAIASAAAGCQRTVELLRQAGLDCPAICGGGSGTFMHEATSGVYTELQAGSYVFMDADYGRNLDDDGKPFSTFRQSLFVLSTVISQSAPGRAAVDAGHKAVAIDSGMPLVWQRPDVRYARASDEHGKLEFGSETAAPVIGEKLRLVPGHCDPTVDRFDWYVGVRGGRVESVWPITARGALH